MKREPVDWIPRGGRRKVALSGVAQTADGFRFKVLLSNISYEGCHMLAEHTLSAGEVIEIDLPGTGRMQAQVRWASEDQAGIRFLLGQSTVEDRRARIGV